jgi:hypothetical protein
MRLCPTSDTPEPLSTTFFLPSGWLCGHQD